MQKSLKILLPIVIVFSSVIIAGVLVLTRPDVQRAPGQTPRPLVRTLTVTPRPHTMIVRSQGTVVPRTESLLIAQVGGQIITVAPTFASGGYFEAGEVIARIDPRDYQVAVAQAKVQVAQAEIRLKMEQEEAELAREEWMELGISEPPPALARREPQLAEARAAYEAAKAALQQAELNLARTEIRAPYACRIRRKQADIGQVVAPGTPIAQIYAIDWAEVRLPLPDDELAYLDLPLDFREIKRRKRGPDVILRAQFAGAMQEWRGYISRLEGEIDPRTRMIHAVAHIENPYGANGDARPPLAVGMFVQAEIIGKTYDHLIELPRSALRDDSLVLVVDAESRLHFRAIEVFRATTDVVYVRSGLRSGERVCLSPLDAVVDGMHVQVATDSTAPMQTVSQGEEQ